MQIRNVGFMTPGDMGQAVAMQIKAAGFNVLTALDKRSERSRTLGREAGLTDVGTIPKLVAESDVVLSVMNPGAAVEFAGEIADAIRSSKRPILFADCNAVAPDTTHQIAKLIQDAGGRYLDGGIIGPPPRNKKTNLYISGPGAADLKPLATQFLQVHILSERIGDASALKMCYGALNKGTQALWLEILIAAQRLGVAEQLDKQVRASHGDRLEGILEQLPTMPPKAYRWVPEMLEISKTLGSAGITPKVFQGAADIYKFVATTPLGKETPEQVRDNERSGKAVVESLAQARR